MVGTPRAWRWSESRETRWGASAWAHETLVEPDATWFSRIALTRTRRDPPIVMLHGVVVSGAYFQPVAAELVGEFDLYIPDLPGTGASTLTGRPWDIATMAERLGWWMDQHHLSDAVLVSNSIGCQVLTQLTAMRPELARSLVLVAPTMDPDVSSVIRVMARGLVDMPRERASLWKVWLPDLVRSGPISSLQILRMAIDDPQVERLPEIGVPVLVVGGERDPIVPSNWIQAMAGHLPEGRAVVIPKAPHALNYTNPRQLARIVRVAAGTWPSASIE